MNFFFLNNKKKNKKNTKKKKNTTTSQPTNNKKIIPKNHFELHYRAGQNKLGGHVDISNPGIEITSGALGHGLGIGCGIALGYKIKKSKDW